MATNRSGAVSQVAVASQGDAAGTYSNFTTEVEVTDRLLLSSGNPKKTAEMIQEEALTGEIGRGTPERGLEVSEDSIECMVPYSHESGTDFISTDTLIAAFMGNNNLGDTGDYNICQLSDSAIYALTLAYVYGTPADGQLKVLTGAIPTSMELSYDISEKLQASFDFAAYDFGDSADSTNTCGKETGVDAIPHIGHSNIMGQHATFRIASDSTALEEDDQLTVRSLTLSIDKNYDTDTYGTPENSGHTDPQKILLPIVDGRRDVTLEFEIPKYEAETFITGKDAGTSYHADLKFTDGTNNFNIYMPNIVVEDVDIPMDGSGRLTQTVSCILGRRDSDLLSDGEMTFSEQLDEADVNVDKEVGIEMNNDRTAAIL